MQTKQQTDLQIQWHVTDQPHLQPHMNWVVERIRRLLMKASTEGSVGVSCECMFGKSQTRASLTGKDGTEHRIYLLVHEIVITAMQGPCMVVLMCSEHLPAVTTTLTFHQSQGGAEGGLNPEPQLGGIHDIMVGAHQPADLAAVKATLQDMPPPP